MNMAHRFLGVLLLGVLLLSVAAAVSVPALPGAPDFPLALKSKWTYHLRQELSPGVHFGPELASLAKGNVLETTLVSEVTGSDTIGGRAYVRVESRRAGSLWLTEWYRLAPEGLLLGKTIDADAGQETRMVPPQKLLSATLNAGESWTWQASDAPVTSRTTVIGPASVVVPAGTFQATKIVIEMTIQAEGMVIRVRQNRWFAPGVGYVRQETEMRAGERLLNRVELSLEKFERGPAAAK